MKSIKILIRAAFASVILAVLAGNLPAQNKFVALTIDDLPLNGPPIGNRRLGKMTKNLLTVIKTNRLPFVGFVNESLLYIPNETDQRINLLRQWQNAGVELGNHTFSHLGFKTATLAEYADDFVRGDAVTRLLVKPNKPRYFRHPFLQMGQTREVEEAFEKFIAERGYRIIPVTIDTMDWMFLAAYTKGVNEKNKKFQNRVADEYLKFIGEKIDAAERSTKILFGRNIKHILLLHANELNGDHFTEVINVLKTKGYGFITVEEALRDDIYRNSEKYLPVSDWLTVWAENRGVQLQSPQPPKFVQEIFEGK